MWEIGPVRGQARGVVGGRTRRGLLGPAAGMVGLLAAACAGREAARTSSAPSPSGQPVRLRYMGRGTIANQDLQKAGLAEFQAAQPKIAVEFEAPAQFLPALLAQIAGGDAVDVAYTAIGNFRGLAKQGGLVELDPFIARDIKKADYYEYALESVRYNGKYFAFPYDGGTWALAYNKEHFDKAQVKYPDDTWTWDTYAATAARLTVDQGGRRSGDSGFDPAQVAQYGSAPSLREHWWYHVWANGGEVLSADRKKAVLDSPAALETIQWIADLGTRRVVMPTPAYPEADMVAVNGDAGFTAGRVAMAAHGRWRVPEIRRLAKFEWDVAPMPKGKAARLGYGWYSGMSIVNGTKHPAEAWEVARFFGTEAGQRDLVVGGLNVPPLQKMANTDVFLKSTPPANNRAYLDAIANSRLTLPGPYVIEPDKWNAVLNPALNAIWAGRQTAQAAIPPLIAALNDVLGQTQG
jgi:multiple sugar transport system substrate-binding protein